MKSVTKTNDAPVQWQPTELAFTDIHYVKSTEGIAKITIDRQEVRNAFRPRTIKEMRAALADARDVRNLRPDFPRLVRARGSGLQRPQLREDNAPAGRSQVREIGRNLFGKRLGASNSAVLGERTKRELLHIA